MLLNPDLSPFGTKTLGFSFHLVALGSLPEGDRGLHSGACTARSEGEPGDDPGIKALHCSKCASRAKGVKEDSGRTGPDKAVSHSSPFPMSSPEWDCSGQVEGEPRAGCLVPGWGSLPGVAPRPAFWMSPPFLDCCPTSRFAIRLVTVCAALTGQRHAGPPICTDGGLF